MHTNHTKNVWPARTAGLAVGCAPTPLPEFGPALESFEHPPLPKVSYCNHLFSMSKVATVESQLQAIRNQQ